jgi:hypothetical protein
MPQLQTETATGEEGATQIFTLTEHPSQPTSTPNMRFSAPPPVPSGSDDSLSVLNAGDFDIVRPDAGALSEALRAFGYSPQSAVADLIDNSITAGARDIRLRFEWRGGSSWVAVRDDGHGMTAEELVQAMRPGSRHPGEVRDHRDLGRYGLGLKTASFSQSRRVTVCSRREGREAAVRCWDLDEISASGDWRLLRRVSPDTETILRALTPTEHGTVVLWEHLDRVVSPDADPDDDRAQQRFFDTVREIEEHLRMVFHRFLSSRPAVQMHINGQPLRPWDPFLASNTATQAMPPQTMRIGAETIQVRGYVLPHHSRLTGEAHSAAAGPRGWNDQQGFYVYRQNRLLVAGSWLGLFRKEEHHKLARVAIDIPNSLDGAWSIDVRKSRAAPPGSLREPLRAYAKLVRERAVEVYRFRGKILARSTSDDHVFAWNRVQHHGAISYRINRRHPLVASALASPDRDGVSALLHLIEETVPVTAIRIDASEHPDSQTTPFDGVAPETTRRVLVHVYRALRQAHPPDRCRELIASMEAFSNHPELVAAIDDDVLTMQVSK